MASMVFFMPLSFLLYIIRFRLPLVKVRTVDLQGSLVGSIGTHCTFHNRPAWFYEWIASGSLALLANSLAASGMVDQNFAFFAPFF